MSTTQLKSITELIAVARSHTIRSLPTETRQSYPIPLASDNGIRVAFLYCTSIVSGRVGLQLLPPHYLAGVNAATGKFEGIKKVTPETFGQSDAEDQVIGLANLPPGMTMEKFLALEQRLYEGYDRVLPAFRTQRAEASPELKAAAADFRTLFNQLAEEPLLPYYRAVGREFFAWLSQVSSGGR